MDWTTQTMLGAFTTRADGRALGFAIARHPDGKQWVVQAFETSSSAAGMEGFYADHAHTALPPVKQLSAALELAEKYARHWRRTGALHGECGCEEIKLPAASPTSSRRQIPSDWKALRRSLASPTSSSSLASEGARASGLRRR